MREEAKADLPKVQQMFKIMEDSIGLQAPASPKEKGGKSATGGISPEQIRAQYQSGKLTREQARQMLAEQGFK
jgi:hypothetical protein